VARPTGTWLSGLGAAGIDTRPPGGHRGARLGLPEDGPGSVATFGRRAAAYVLDAVIAALVAGAFVQPPELWSFVPLAVAYVLLVPLVGQTPGMRLLKLRLVTVAGGPLSLPRAVLRFVLLSLLLPAVISDPDGRGLHDKAAGSVVVRA
jgi:uncharacterized RDD family membrane protein YckC